MKQDLKILAEHIEKKLGKASVLHKMHPAKATVLHDMNPAKASMLRKMWDVMKGKEKPSRQTLDRLALLAGFQSWADFQDALHGTGDGLVNYSSGE